MCPQAALLSPVHHNGATQKRPVSRLTLPSHPRLGAQPSAVPSANWPGSEIVKIAFATSVLRIGCHDLVGVVECLHLASSVMLAPKTLPQEYRAWNRAHGAPNGPSRAHWRGSSRVTNARWFGMFGHQRNNNTRRFEYPWAWHAVPVHPGLVAVDIGGSLAGFQFALSKAGVDVTNVDPGLEAGGRGWPVDRHSIGRLNRAFKTNVRLVNTTLSKAELPDASVDVVYSISTIEHIPIDELPGMMTEIERILKPGGHCVLTVDLFLNLEPFTLRTSNEYGTNVPPAELINVSGMKLVAGERAELLGFPQFDPTAVLAHLEDYMIGTYPCLAQCFVLEKGG